MEDVRLRLAAIVDSSDDAILSKDLDGVIRTWNPAAERMFGYSADEVIGRSITMLIPPELQSEEGTILKRIRAGERIDHYETRRITKDDRTLEVSLTISPVRDDAGTIIGASKILRDVTERNRAQAALLESERRLARELSGARALQSISLRLSSEISQSSLFAQILDTAMELMNADASSVQLLASDGRSLTLLASRNFHPDSSVFWQRVTTEAGSTCGVALRNGHRVMVSDVETCEFMAGTRDLHEYRRCGIRAVQSTPLRSRTSQPLGMLSTHWYRPYAPSEDEFRLFDVAARQAADLIERMRAEDDVRESEARFRLIANAAPVMIWITDSNQHCTWVNETCLATTGQTFDEMVGTGWLDRVHPQDVVRLWDRLGRAFEMREPFDIEYRLRHRDGGYRWIVTHGVPRYHGDGLFAGYIGSALDITERRHAQDALATMNQRLFDAVEEERGRIARELHDDVVQRLSVLSMRLHSLLQPVRASRSSSVSLSADGDHASVVIPRGSDASETPLLTPDAMREIQEADEEVVTLAKDVQALSRRLHPARLEYLGIERAAAAMCREISSQHRVPIGFHAEGVRDGLPSRVTVCLYRVLQESLHNAVKHSEAARIDVSLRGDADEIRLTVRDSGKGFDVEAPGRPGLGLTSMRERLNTVHGWLVIRSTSEHGTTVDARVPLAGHEDALRS